MSGEHNYSALDRLVHRLAFCGQSVQFTAADVERSLFRHLFCSIPVERPVFITSLPRAGTTLLLETLCQWPEFKCYQYRDMPFILAPLMWDRLSARFRKLAVMKERAHGDGMEVGYDSPEAFEEVLWRAYWPEKFTNKGILLWSEGEEAQKFRDFFVEQMQKVIFLRIIPEATRCRYLSKNNANIARIGLLKRLFPDAVIVIPFRDPINQAASLWRQHRKFLELHRRDPFSRRYMNDIGHLEFGSLHQPIRFAGTDELLRRYRPENLDYWLAYWYAAFEHIVRLRHEVVLMPYENWCEGGEKALGTLLEYLQIELAGPLKTAAARLQAPTCYGADKDVENRDLLTRARALHRQLLDVSLIPS